MATRIAMAARRYYTADLHPRIVHTRADPPPTHRARRRDICWRLLPRETWSQFAEVETLGASRTSEELAVDLTVMHSGRGSVIRMLDEVFVPTIWGRVDPENVALARQVAGR